MISPPPKASQRNENLLVMQYVPPTYVPVDLDEVPGVRVEPHVDYPGLYALELPRNVWSLPSVRLMGETLGVDFEALLTRASDTPPASWGLYPHQVEAVEFFTERRQILLGDVMGLGKTRTAIACLELARRARGDERKPVLIVAPKFLRDTWRRELKALLGDDIDLERDFCALDGRDYQTGRGYKPGAKWIFVHYEILYGWWSFLYAKRPFGCIVDEVHLCKGGSKTLRGKGLELMTSSLAYKVLLSGTPILNRPGEFYNILRLVQHPWSFGTPRTFRTRYAGAVSDDYGLVDTRPTNTEELQTRLSTCYLRRTLDDAGVNLPELTRTNLVVTPDEATLTKYRELLSGMDPRTILDAFERGLGGKQTIAWLGKMRKLTTKAKMPLLLEDLEAVTGEGEKAVVFVWQRETADDIVKALVKHKVGAVAIHGDMKQTERDRHIEAFQASDGDPQVIVATYGALSVGVTLHRARTVYLHDLEWVPATMLQAEARVYRIGQKRAVQSKWVVCANTLDELLARKVQAKAEWISGLLGDEQPADLGDHLAEQFGTEADELENDIAAYLTALRRG